MKCDVCGTQIPIGANECPNCGYKYRISSTNTYDASSQNHQHIKAGHEKTKPTYRNVSYQTKQHHFPIKAITISIGVIFSIIFILLIVIPFIFGIIDGIKEITSPRVFQQTIDEGYMIDSTLSMALEEENKIVDLFSYQMGLEDVDVDEYVSDQTSHAYASVCVDGFDNEDYYALTSHFYENQCIGREITIMWDSEESIRQGDVYVNQEIWNQLKEYTGIDVYDYFHKYRTQMVLENDEYIFNDSYVYDIYISETKEDGYYSIYYSISNIWE